jgi:hypothetical protein
MRSSDIVLRSPRPVQTVKLFLVNGSCGNEISLPLVRVSALENTIRKRIYRIFAPSSSPQSYTSIVENATVKPQRWSEHTTIIYDLLSTNPWHS